MSYQAEFTGWRSLTIEDLLIAYRKAKADCFFENTFPTAIKFTEYEQNLLANLNGLLGQLKTDKGFKNNNKLWEVLDYYRRNFLQPKNQILLKTITFIFLNQKGCRKSIQ